MEAPYPPDDAELPEQHRQWEADHQDWIDEQNARFDQYGLWCDDLRVW